MTRGKQSSGSPSEASGASEASEANAGDPEAQARHICLRLLETAPRTRAQLATALRRRAVPREAAEAVLARFTDVGLIDDTVFARAWVESRHYSRGLSRRSLSAELRQQGIETEEIDAAVGTIDPQQEVATARRLVEQKMAGTRGQPPEVRIRRAAGTLARKGYLPGLVFRLIKEVLEQEGTPDVLDMDPDQYLDPDN
jgi:regulatory protein